jgi:Raf kinase inhibitor-like YbhB/YbcL family protein
MKLESPSFKHNAFISPRFTCCGEDVSPQLAWEGAPSNTQSFAMIMDDPDAPGATWVHWILFDIPAEVNALPEDIPDDAVLDGTGKHGLNSWGRVGYGGPCPPSGIHRYFFKLYALDTILKAQPKINKKELLQKMGNHILEKTELVGQFKRI